MSMNKTMKTILCVSGCIFAVGVVCSGIGYALGARPNQLRYNNHMNMNGMMRDMMGGMMSGSGWSDFIDTDDYEDYYESNNYYQSSYNKNYLTPSVIKGIDLVSECGNVVVSKGDENRIEFININEKDLTVYEDKGVYKIKLLERHCGNNHNQKVVIKVKDDEVLDSLKIYTQAGAITVKELDFKEIDLTSEAGAIKLVDVESDKTTVKADVGTIVLKGDFRNDTVIEGSVGAIDLEFDDSQDAYDYVIRNEMGMIKINGENQVNGGKVANQNKQAKHHLSVSHGTGMVTVRFDD